MYCIICSQWNSFVKLTLKDNTNFQPVGDVGYLKFDEGVIIDVSHALVPHGVWIIINHAVFTSALLKTSHPPNKKTYPLKDALPKCCTLAFSLWKHNLKQFP